MAEHDYKFKKHKLSKAEIAWIREVGINDLFDPKKAKVLLWDRLPKGFDPNRIDTRFYSHGKLMPIGLWYLDEGKKLYENADIVANFIKKLIFQAPGIEKIEAKDVAKETGLSPEGVGRALFTLGGLGGFYSSASGASEKNVFTAIGLQGDSAYDRYLNFTSIEDVLEEYYLSRDPDNESAERSVEWNHVADDYLLAGKTIPIERQATTKTKPNTAFVLMAIDPSKPQLEDIYSAIKDVCGLFGISAYRADKIEHQGRITDRVLEEIATSEYLVADLSYERPNVYYEIGYAHALNKKPILYRQANTKLHFDLAVHNAPEYKNITELRDMLKKRFEAILGRSPK